MIPEHKQTKNRLLAMNECTPVCVHLEMHEHVVEKALDTHL